MQPSRLRSIILVSLLPVAACGGAQTAGETFSKDLDAFHAHLRWGRFEEASNYLADGEREEFLGEIEERGKGYQVTEFEVRSVAYDDAAKSATVVVWMQSYQLPSTRVREETVTEYWAWNREYRSWEITDLERQ